MTRSFALRCLVVAVAVLTASYDEPKVMAAGGIVFRRPAVRFEVNQGQSNSAVRFMAQAPGTSLFLTANGAIFHLQHDARAEGEGIADAALRLRPVEGASQPSMIGLEPLPGVTNYLIGSDPTRWVTGVVSYRRVKYQGVYRGVDLVYYGTESGDIEYDFEVSPGADPSVIALAVEGTRHVAIDSQTGDALIETTVGQVRQHAPIAYQESNGQRRAVPIRFVLRGAQSSKVLGFEVGDYDSSQPMVIDPVVVYATLIGGAAGNFDGASGVTVDAVGNAYVTGQTESSDFPSRNALDPVPPARFTSKAFLSKFAPDGSLVFSTFLGGSDSNSDGAAVAIAADGALWLTGSAGAGFPVKNAIQIAPNSPSDAFVAKLKADGTDLFFSTYVGGNQGENVRSLALDAAGNAVVLGEIGARGQTSVTFPLVNPVQANYGGGDRDLFIFAIAGDGTKLLFSSFLGGSDDESAKSVTVTTSGNTQQVQILMESGSLNVLAPLAAPEDPDISCDELNPALFDFEGGGWLLGQTLVRRMADELGRAPTCAEILDVLRNPHHLVGGRINSLATAEPPELVVGSRGSGAPPVASQDPMAGGGYDISLAELSADGLKSVMRFGGRRDEFVSRATIDAAGATYVIGDTNSPDFPTVSPTQTTFGGGDTDGFVAVFAPNTYQPLFATYLGGDGEDLPESIAVDASGNIYVAGIVTIATTFPTTPGALQREIKGRNDGFLVKISSVVQQPPKAPGGQ